MLSNMHASLSKAQAANTEFPAAPYGQASPKRNAAASVRLHSTALRCYVMHCTALHCAVALSDLTTSAAPTHNISDSGSFQALLHLGRGPG